MSFFKRNDGSVTNFDYAAIKIKERIDVFAVRDHGMSAPDRT